MAVTVTDTASYPATERQKASWKEYLNAGKKMVLNIVSSIDIGNVNVSSVEKAVQALVNRHEGLRTIFVPGDAGLRQVVLPVTKFRLNVQTIDCSSLLGIYKVQSIIGNERLMIFDLERGPLARVLLILLRNKKAKVVITMQHIICDANSIQVLADDFLFFYNCYENEKIPQRPALPYQMRDFALWEQQRLETNEGRINLEYWENELGRGLEEFKFKKEWLRSERADRWTKENRNGGEYVAYISREVLSDVKMLSFKSKTTKLCFFCLAFFCLLNYLSAQEELMIIVPISLRDRKELNDVIGFLNTDVYLRMKLDLSLSPGQLLATVSEKYFKALEHRHHRIEQVLDRGHRYCAGVLNELPSSKGIIANFKSRYVTKNSGQKAFFPLFFMLTEFANGLQIDCIYDNAIVNGKKIPKLLEHYKTLVTAMVQRPDESTSDILSSLHS